MDVGESDETLSRIKTKTMNVVDKAILLIEENASLRTMVESLKAENKRLMRDLINVKSRSKYFENS